MEESHLVEKLSLQAESFQEGFEILIKSSSFSEMILNFENVMRGTFLISDIRLFYKKKPGNQWEKISRRGKVNDNQLNYFNNKTSFSIDYPDKDKTCAVAVLPLDDSAMLGIILGGKLDKTEFTVFDKITLQILIQVFDSAYKSFLNQKKVKELLFELNNKVSQLNNLIDTGIELSKCNSQDLLCEHGLMRGTSLTNASSALIEITDNIKNSFNLYVFPRSADPEEIRKSTFCIESKFDYKNISSRFVLSEKETRNGVTNFNDLDKILLDAISRQILASLENQDLHQQAIEKEKIEKELNVAASIQQLIIPRELPEIIGYDIAAINIPSKEVGGDYYDCIPLPGNKYALIIADVAGKGIAAALLVNTLSAALHSYLEFDITPAELASRLNTLIYNSTTPDKFITFFIALLDIGKNEISVINAGHNPVFLLRKNKILEEIKAGGLGLGMVDFGIPFTGQSFTINQGDSLFLYTDGIPEAMDINENMYSDDKLTEFFLINSDLPAKDFINAIVQDVSGFTGTAERSDDITAVYLKRL